MDTDLVHDMTCAICGRPVDLRQAVTGDMGEPQHEECYVRTLIAKSSAHSAPTERIE